MKQHLSVLSTILCASLSACTTIPTASGQVLSRADNLSAAKGTRGKRLQTAAPNPPIANGAKLRISPAGFVEGADISAPITAAERALILNSLNRSACSDLSSQFEIVETDTPGETFVLRTGVTRLTATGKIGAAIGNVTGFFVPVVGLRPPLGLGALTVEFELLKPDATQAAAMVWSQSADVLSGDAAASRIGDAYAFTQSATLDFSNLVGERTSGQQAMAAVRSIVSNKQDQACDAYGKEGTALTGVIGFLGVTVPPEIADKGARPPAP